MTETKATAKKATTKAAAAKTTTVKKAPAAKAPAKKTAAKKAEVIVDAQNAGFSAGDIYQALSAAGSAMTVAQLAKATAKTEGDVLLGIGWLLREGKVNGDANQVSLA